MAASATLCNLVFSLATLASVSAVPMMPFSSGLMGMLGLGHGPFPGSGVAVDARSKAGASYSGSQDSSHDHQLSTPSMLSVASYIQFQTNHNKAMLIWICEWEGRK